MSSSDNSIVVLAAIDVGLAIAVIAALLLPRARAAVFPAVLAGLAGFLGAVAIDQISSSRPEPPTPGLETRIRTIEQDIVAVRGSLAATRDAAARSQDTAGKLQQQRMLVIHLNKLKETSDPPKSTPPTAPGKITIGQPSIKGAHVNLTLQNSGIERAAITAGDLSFCPVGGPSEPRRDCTPAPLNKLYPSCKRTFVCPEDRIILDAGPVGQRPLWATIPPHYVRSRSTFSVIVKLECTDAQGRDCSTEMTSEPVEFLTVTRVGHSRSYHGARRAPTSDAAPAAPLWRRADG